MKMRWADGSQAESTRLGEADALTELECSHPSLARGLSSQIGEGTRMYSGERFTSSAFYESNQGMSSRFRSHPQTGGGLDALR